MRIGQRNESILSIQLRADRGMISIMCHVNISMQHHTSSSDSHDNSTRGFMIFHKSSNTFLFMFACSVITRNCNAHNINKHLHVACSPVLIGWHVSIGFLLHVHSDFSVGRNNTYLPVCKKRWFFRFVCLEKPREQMWHLNGHDPLCTYMCDLRSPGVGNDFEHRPHLCGFSCVTRK